MKKFKLTTAQIALMMAIVSFGAKILGFLREMFLANYFGAGMITDAFVMGQAIPNTLMAAIISAVATAYMPILATRFVNGGEKSANKFTSQLINALMGITAILYVIAFIFSDQIVGIFAPGYNIKKVELTVFYMRFAFLGVLFSGGLTILDAYLQYKNVFNAQTVIGYIQGFFTILFIILAAKFNYHLLILGLVIGPMARFICELFLAKAKGFRYTADFQFSSTIKEIMQLALPVFIGGSIGEINTFVDKMFASSLPEGSVSALNYSSTVIGVILVFVVTIFVTIVYPKIARAFANEDLELVSSLSERGINLLSLVSIPCALGSIVYAKECIYVVYERGAFDSVATTMAATAFMYYAIKIPFYAINQLLIRVFYSMHDAKTPMICSSLSLLVNIGLNFLLVRRIGIAGLAIATSVAAIVDMFLKYYAFKKKYPTIMLLRSKHKLCKIAIFSFVSVAASYGVYLLLSSIETILIKLGISIVCSVLLYLAMLYFAKFEELKLIKDLLKRE